MSLIGKKNVVSVDAFSLAEKNINELEAIVGSYILSESYESVIAEQCPSQSPPFKSRTYESNTFPFLSLVTSVVIILLGIIYFIPINGMYIYNNIKNIVIIIITIFSFLYAISKIINKIKKENIVDDFMACEKSESKKGYKETIISYNMGRLNFLLHLLLQEKEILTNTSQEIYSIKRSLNSSLDIDLLRDLDNYITDIKNYKNNQKIIEMKSLIKEIKKVSSMSPLIIDNDSELVGKAWFYENIDSMQKAICDKLDEINYANNLDKQRKSEIICTVADLLISHIGIIPPLVASAMVINYGINKICNE